MYNYGEILKINFTINYILTKEKFMSSKKKKIGMLGVIEKVAEGSKYEKSLWFKSLSIAGAYIAYKIAALILDTIFTAIFYGTDYSNLASLVYGGASIFS